MRISDWSSDVCSSDLIVFLVLLEAFALLGRTAFFVVGVGLGFFLDLVLVLERNAGILLADLAVVLFLVLQAFGRRVLGQHRLEIQDLAKLHVAVVGIGRASGREKGGQHVEIWVV